jgi:hypothetical protein
MLLGGLSKLKHLNNSAGLESVTIRLVAWCLNQYVTMCSQTYICNCLNECCFIFNINKHLFSLQQRYNC